MDAATLSVLAAHEYTHLYQSMKGDYPPAWWGAELFYHQPRQPFMNPTAKF
jgi:hypothetical protein